MTDAEQAAELEADRIRENPSFSEGTPAEAQDFLENLIQLLRADIAGLVDDQRGQIEPYALAFWTLVGATVLVLLTLPGWLSAAYDVFAGLVSILVGILSIVAVVWVLHPRDRRYRHPSSRSSKIGPWR